MSTAAAPPPVKPLLRGVSHQVAAVLALGAWVGLALTAPHPTARLAAHVYGLSLVVLFSVSALYHRPTWRPKARAWMRRLDHAAIFVLIAGTYTPFCLMLPASTGVPLLSVAWAGAFLGVLLSVVWIKAPKPLVAVVAILLGWAILPAIVPLHAMLGSGVVALIALGGVAYTLGALAYAFRRPNPFPGVFGYHEVFHALVIVASVIHFAAVVTVLGAMPA